MLTSSLILALAGLATFSTAAPTAKNSAPKRQSGGKRGCAFRKGEAENAYQDKTALFTGSGQFSWGYSWEARSWQDFAGNVKYTAPGVEFVPMLHDDGPIFKPGFVADTRAAIAAGSTHILSINEPNICGEHAGGACMDQGRTLAAHRELIQPLADEFPHVKIVSPAYSNDRHDLLLDFLAQCNGCRIDAVATHWYGPTLKEFTDHIQNVRDTTGKPIWVTEFGFWDNSEESLKGAINFLDKENSVERYAYMSVESTLTNGNSLNPLGNVFANYIAH